jgi:hypothetical protein
VFGATCPSCGKKVGVLRRLLTAGLCAGCAEKQRRLRDSAREEYERHLGDLASSPADVKISAERIAQLLADAELPEGDKQRLNDRAFRSYAERALADDLLSKSEETYLLELGSALGIDQDAFEQRHGDLLERLSVAGINDGRMPIIEGPSILTRKDEVVHVETPGAVLEPVTTKKRAGGGYHGLSIPLGKGFRYHVGGVRGRVEQKTSVQPVDAGILSVTSQRVIFTGQTTTTEMPYRRLVRLQIFADAVQFHLTGRKSAPLIQLGPVHAVAAAIGVAAERTS